MKKLLLIGIGLLAMNPVFGQQETSTEAACDCASCLAAAAGIKLPYTLPGLQDLNEEPATNAVADVDVHEQDAHAGHDHGAEEAGHDDQDAHAGHDHGKEL